MKLLGRIAAAVVLLVCAGAATAAASPHVDFYVMRHLQKGDGADPGLTTQGRLSSESLVALLAAHPPKAIFVSTTRRARETAAVVARRWKLVPKEYDPGDTGGLLARVRAEAGPVLIVGQSNTVPDIVAGLGGTRPTALGDGDYGEVWLVTRGGRTRKVTIGK